MIGYFWWAMYITAGLCLMIYVVLILRDSLAICMDATARALALEKGKSMFAVLKSTGSRRNTSCPFRSLCRLPPTDPEEREVFELLERRQQQRLQLFFKVSIHAHAWYVLGYVKWPRSNTFGRGDGDGWDAILSNYTTLALVPLFPVFLVFWSWPSVISTRAVDIVYALYTLRMCQCSIFQETTWMLVSLANFSAVFRLGGGMMIGNAWLVGVVNLIYAYVVILHAPFEVPCGEGRPHWLPFAFREIFTLGVILLVCVTFQRSSYAEAKATVSGQSSRGMMNTVQSLLSVLCDAVLKLDGSWELQEPSRQLSALLLKREEVPKGASFTALLDDMDKRTFVQRLTVGAVNASQNGETTAAKLASSVIVHLQDSNQTRLRVRLYHTSFSDSKGQLLYLVGLQEFQDFGETDERAMAAIENLSDSGGSIEPSDVSADDARSEASRDAAAEEAQRAEALARIAKRRQARKEAVAQAKQLNAESQEGMPRIPETSPRLAGGAVGLPARSSADQVMLHEPDDDVESQASQLMDQSEQYAASFMCQDPGFHIMRASPAFNLLMSRHSDDRNLTSWVHASFAEFVRAEVNLLPADMQDQSDPIHYGEIKLQPPCSRRRGVEYKAECTLFFHKPQGMHKVIGHIELTNIRFKDKSKSKAKRKAPQGAIVPSTLGRSSDDREFVRAPASEPSSQMSL